MDLIVVIIAFVAGAFLGVVLGRRSATANRVVDDTQAKVESLRERARKL